MYEKPTSQSFYEKLLETTNLNCKEIYILPRKVPTDTNLRMFQYKIMNNILFLNKLLFKFKKVPPPLCSFCNSADETPFISSLLVILQNDYGMNFSILFLNIFIFLKSLHRVPFSVFLILAINNRIFY